MVPTMLTFLEQSYYVWLTKSYASGAGAIVDLGAFAGGSTACLAEGVAQAGRSETVHSFDKFLLLDFERFKTRYNQYIGRSPARDAPFDPPGLPRAQGKDFLPIVRHFLSPWSGKVELHKGQIEDLPWSGGPIEILVLDASKTAATMDRMSATFFPHLRPGALVVQQDLLRAQQPWIAAQMALLEAYFEPVAHVPRHSVTYLCTAPVPQAVMQALSVHALQDKEIIAALRRAKQSLKPFKVDGDLRLQIRAVKENPGIRDAFQMKKPAED
jgi:hypothetical protein